MKRPPASLFALLAFSLLSLVLTWPLITVMGRDVPGDLGDSLLNMWILAWGAEHVPQLLTGAMTWSQYWDANIFHPAPMALSLSEHLFAQVLQVLPVYWLTGNIILCYNLLFVSTFALSAYGTYLLVRDLTGDWRAAFIAGLIYGFLPYRMASVPHLQVMSSQWMPLALWGLNRFVTSGSYRALTGGTAALVMQNWSCGYYLLYFAPFAPLFVVHRMWALGTLGTLRTWVGLMTAAVGTSILTLPFLLPYAAAQEQLGFSRPLSEVVGYSANVWSYVTAPESLWLYGKSLRFFAGPEGETFLGFVPWLLAGVAIVALLQANAGGGGAAPDGLAAMPAWRRTLVGLLALAVVTQLAAVVSALAFGGFDVTVLGIAIRARSPGRMVWQLLAAVVFLLMASPRSRVIAARAARSPAAFCAVATLAAMWLSLGPVPRAGDSLAGYGLYGVLYQYVPGFTGVRVPARFAMLAGLFLSVLAGYGVAAGLRRWPARPFAFAADAPAVIAAGIAALVLIEGVAIPIDRNLVWGQNEAMPPARVYPVSEAPPVYAAIRALPAGAAITEFPFGDPAWEIRYVYYAATHWKPITNGYSGSVPPGYGARVARLSNVAADPEASWQALVASGTTHVVLHARAFADAGRAGTVEAWLLAHNARLLAQFPDGDTLFALR